MEKRCSIEEMASSIVEARDALVAALGDCPALSRQEDARPVMRRVK